MGLNTAKLVTWYYNDYYTETDILCVFFHGVLRGLLYRSKIRDLV